MELDKLVKLVKLLIAALGRAHDYDTLEIDARALDAVSGALGDLLRGQKLHQEGVCLEAWYGTCDFCEIWEA